MFHDYHGIFPLQKNLQKNAEMQIKLKKTYKCSNFFVNLDKVYLWFLVSLTSFKCDKSILGLCSAVLCHKQLKFLKLNFHLKIFEFICYFSESESFTVRLWMERICVCSYEDNARVSDAFLLCLLSCFDSSSTYIISHAKNCIVKLFKKRI